MTEFLPDDDEEVIGPNTEDAVFIGRVPLSIDGIVFADIYSTEGTDAFPVLLSNFNIEPLETAIGLDRRSEPERFVDDVLGGIEEIPDGWTYSKTTRGPYYGLDQLYNKLSGMKSALHLILAVYEDTDELGGDVYYVEIGNS